MNPKLYRFLWKTKKYLTDRGLLRQLDTLERNQWLSADELRNIQWRKIERILKHAYERVPFYRDRFDKSGLKPEDVRSYEDYLDIPILTKEDVRSNLERMVPANVDRNGLKKSFTGGSTGVPLAVYHDLNCRRIIHACDVRSFKWLGIRHGDKVAHIWGLNRSNTPNLYSQQSKIRRFRNNRVLLDAFDMNEENMVEFAKILLDFRPKLVISYVTAMYEFGKFLRDRNISTIRTKAIQLTAERTGDFHKELIEDAFKAPVYDHYGSCEIYWYALQCEMRSGLHIFSDIRYLEFIDDNGLPTPPNMPGRIIVTDLENYSCPLIRYENGDMGSLMDKSCTCGRGYPLMNPVKGRIYDMVTLPMGKRIHGQYFTSFFYDYKEEVKQFQVHQVSLSTVHIYMILDDNVDRDRLFNSIDRRLKDYTNGLINFEYSFVDSIDKEQSGKYRFVKSDVSK